MSIWCIYSKLSKMGRLSQLRTLQPEVLTKQKTKPIEVNQIKQFNFNYIHGNRPERSQLYYVSYYQTITAILPPIFAKLVPITIGWPDSDEFQRTNPIEANRLNRLNFIGIQENRPERSQLSYRACYHSLTGILTSILRKLVPNARITIADSPMVRRNRVERLCVL